MASGKSGSIWASLGLQTKDFEKGINKAKGNMSSFKKSSNSFASDITKMFVGAFAVHSIIDFGKEISRLSGEMQGVSNAFTHLGDATLLDKIRAATKGTVSDLNLMKQAVSAKNLGLPIQQLGTYFEFARRRAKETGESVDYLTDSIVKGIGRKSPLILDNLGISTTALNEELKKTPDFATAVGNIIEREMGGMAADIDTTAEATARVSASWENYMTQLGSQTTGPINAATKALNDLLTTITETDQATEKAAKLGFDRKAFSELDKTASKYVEFNKLVNDNAAEFAANETNVSRLRSSLKYFKEQADKVNKGTDEGRVKLITYSEAMKTISTRIEELGKKGAKSISVMTDAQIKAVAKQKKALQELNKLKEGLDFSVSSVASKGLQLKPSDLPTFQIQEGIAALPSQFDMAMASLESRVKRTQDVMTASASAINAAFLNIAVEGLATFGAALGTAFAGGDVMQIGMQFANVIADAIGGLGKNLIQIGITMTGIMETLKSGGFSNPALLIGGGIALVALSSAMKGMVSQSVGFADGGLVTGSVFANIGEGIGTNSANPEVIAPLDKLKNFINPNQGSGMGGGDVKFRIEGNSLVGILDRQSKNTKYSR